MADVRPFRAYRPSRELASRVACPPYDVLNTEEAREMARGSEVSFLHVNKPEIDFAADHDPYAPDVYAKGRENLQAMIAQGLLVRDAAPSFYVYRQRMGDHVQTGLVAGASVAEYERDLIKKHEYTRPDKEDDRTRHIDELDANDEPVFLTYFARPDIDALTGTDSGGAAGIRLHERRRHRPRTLGRLGSDRGGRPPPALRGSAGSVRGRRAPPKRRGHARVRRPPQAGRGAMRGSAEQFLAVLFPHNQMKILAYNRVVRDLAGMSEEAFLARVRERFDVTPAAQAEPERERTFGMFVGGRWLRLVPKAGTVPEDDPVNSLDAAVLQNNLLSPILGIGDPRTDKRIGFVGGIRGTAELQKQVAEREGGGGLRPPSREHRAADPGRGRRPGDAAQVDLVRTQASIRAIRATALRLRPRVQ